MARSKYILGWVLAMGVTSSLALSIGTVRGDVWIEQPLDLTVPIQLDPANDSSALCASAEVAYGDAPVESRAVRVTQEPGNEPGNVRLRIVSTVPINDAVVNLTVYVGCEQKVVRRYLMLPDVPPLAAAPAPRAAPLVEAPVTPAEPAQPVVTAAPAPAKPAAPRAGGSTGTAKASGARSNKATPPPKPAPAASGAPHLTLGPLVIMERKLVPEQASVAPDPEMVAAQEALQKLRQDYEGLQLQASRTEAEFATLRQHLAKAESDRNTILAVAGGGFGVLVVLTAVGLVWWGRRERARLEAVQAGEDEEAQALLSDLHLVAADKWMAPGPFQPDLEEEPATTMVDIDLALPVGPPPTPPR